MDMRWARKRALACNAASLNLKALRASDTANTQDTLIVVVSWSLWSMCRCSVGMLSSGAVECGAAKDKKDTVKRQRAGAASAPYGTMIVAYMSVHGLEMRQQPEHALNSIPRRIDNNPAIAGWRYGRERGRAAHT